MSEKFAIEPFPKRQTVFCELYSVNLHLTLTFPTTWKPNLRFFEQLSLDEKQKNCGGVCWWVSVVDMN